VTEYIEIRGARENNLKSISLRIPKRRITVFTGVSGSGKSSIVFDTIATEAQRQLYGNFSFFVRSFLPRYPQPDADSIDNLSMAVIVDQKRLGGGFTSTVGTITDIYTLLRLLFSRLGQPPAGYANAFSFNDPQGMCPERNGLGRKTGVVWEELIDRSESLNEGAVRVPFFAGWESTSFAASGLFDNDRKVADYTSEEMDMPYEGLLGAGTLTGRYLTRALPIKDVSVYIPTGVLVAITGVAGSGKSSSTSRSCPSVPRRWSSTRLPWAPRTAQRQHRHRHRAQPGRDPQRRLDHRHRAGGRQQGWSGDLRGYARADARGEWLPEQPLSATARTGGRLGPEAKTTARPG